MLCSRLSTGYPSVRSVRLSLGTFLDGSFVSYELLTDVYLVYCVPHPVWLGTQTLLNGVVSTLMKVWGRGLC